MKLLKLGKNQEIMFLVLRWLDPSIDTGFLPVAGLPVEPLPTYETYVFTMGILSVVVVNFRTGAYDAYRS
jgi:hypothetical protein